MTVGKNCGDVLRQLAHLETTNYYWVDAICINQSDEQEKSHQVAMMGEIFGRAHHVLACIGTPHSDGKSLAIFLRESNDYMALCGQSTTNCIEALRGAYSSEKEQYLRCSKQWLTGLSEARAVRFREALDEVAELPYFERIWILQELFLARRIRIFYGFNELSLSILVFWWQHSRPEWSFPGRDDDKPLLYKTLCSTRSGVTCIEKIRFADPEFFTEVGGSCVGVAYEYFLLRCAFAIETKPAQRSLICLRNTLDLCEGRKCKNERDTVYGTLALAEWRDLTALTPDGDIIKFPESVLRPDYTKSTIDLAKELLPFVNHFDQMLQILKMLKITSPYIDISDETARRRRACRSVRIESDEHIVSLAKQSGQKHVQVAGKCVQLTSKGPWKLKHLERCNRRYRGIISPNGELCGITSAGIHTKDWIFFPTRCLYAIVIRQINATSQFYSVVGRVAWLPGDVPENFPVTGCILFLGVDDTMIHLTQDVDLGEKWSNRTGLSEASHAALNLPFCAAQCSSVALIPTVASTYSEDEFDINRKGDHITIELLARCRRKLLGMRGY